MKIIQQDNIGSHYRSAIYRLMDKKFDCDFCFGDKVDDIKKMDYSQLSHNVIEVKNIHLLKGVYYQKGVIKLIRENYDRYIFIGEIRCLSTWLMLLGILFYPNKKIYLWSHGILEKASSFKRILLRIFYGISDGAFIYNERSTKLLAQEGISEKKLHTIYNSLDYDAQLPIRKALKASCIYKKHFCNEYKNIIFIGRLTKIKRFDLLIDAVLILKKKGEFVNVTFIGDGSEKHNMEQKILELGIREQFWFYGACYDELANAELIFNADLCVSPGNIGLTAMHVLMFGCPVVTNDDFDHQMPEFEAIKSGITGAFFNAGDSTSLAYTISNWFASHKSDRKKVREACYEEIDRRWNPHNQIRIIKEVFGIN